MLRVLLHCHQHQRIKEESSKCHQPTPFLKIAAWKPVTAVLLNVQVVYTYMNLFLSRKYSIVEKQWPCCADTAVLHTYS